MMPSAAITAVCGIGNTRSAQKRPMPKAQAQLSYFRSVSRASLASWVGIVAQEASTSAKTPITIKPNLTSASNRLAPACGPALLWLQPAAHARLVVPIGIAEPPLQVRLLAANDAVANCDCQRQHENQSPCASGAHTDAPVEQKHAEIDGIAAPAVDAGHHQGAGRFLGGYWRRRSGEVANTRGCERKTDEDEATGDRPLEQVTARNGERQREQAIRGKAEQESSEKEKRRSRYDTRGLLVHLLPCPIHAHASSRRCSQTTTKVSFCHLTMKVSTRKVVWLTEWNGDGVGTRQESGTP